MQKLYNCHLDYVGPREHGEHVRYYTDLGHVLADNKKEAVEKVERYVDVGPEQAIHAFLVRRCRRNASELCAVLQKQRRERLRLVRSTFDIERWINSCK